MVIRVSTHDRGVVTIKGLNSQGDDSLIASSLWVRYLAAFLRRALPPCF